MDKYEKLESSKGTQRIKGIKPKQSSAKKKDAVNNEMPPEFQSKLHSLFREIEKEFYVLHQENLNLQEKLDVLSEKYDNLLNGSLQPNVDKTDKAEGGLSSESNDGNLPGSKGKKPSASQLMSQKLKTTYKASTSKLVSSFKIPNTQGGSLYCQMVKKFCGHWDGIWEISCKKNNKDLIGTASADRTAKIWHVDSSNCLITYQAHVGSVNSIRFNPSNNLVCTGSGDGTCHIWKLHLPSAIDNQNKQQNSKQTNSGIDSPGVSGDEDPDDDGGDQEFHQEIKIKTSISQLSGHEGPVASADWWQNGTQVFTASWDRTVKLWDVETCALIHTLEGHELDITYASAHSVQKLIVTTSSDTTFRLWDFRLPSMHSVNVFQGHTDTVRSAVFTSKADHVVSGSDDRTVKVWDLKNMRSPLATIRLDSAVNRLSLSPTQNLIAIPHDNRQVRIYDLSGNRLSRLPRRNGQGHQRIVCTTAWLDDTNSSTRNIQLITAGFDKIARGWNVVL